ncbi:cytochrome B [Pandoraea terrae]|uniref:Cytochrome B n=1 Tax=Pandoraea terrae TaxID=1537710 RepID=A0A5E4WBP8_9BURK|nr:cytochrome b [Pandoraea terrae]VVE21573.1 cytochrome B [Pandoraea terrae]
MHRSQQYDGFARLLHWGVLIVLVAQYGVAWTMPDIGKDTLPVGLVAWHLLLGTAILALTVIRAVWRLSHAAPVSVASPTLRFLARTGHLGLYALLFAVPVMGWINASSRGYAVTLLGVVPLPALSPVGSALGHAFGDIHAIASYVLIGLIGVHVLGTLYHQLVLRDNTLSRMLPGRD